MESIRKELGIRSYLNAGDTFTKYGGSCMPECALSAMREMAESFVNLSEVQEKIGDAVARMTGNEAAYLTNGAAGGLLLSAAVCIAGDSMDAYKALPDTANLPRNEIIIFDCQDNPYVSSIRGSGAKLVRVGSRGQRVTGAELTQAFSGKTAAVYYFIYHGRAQSLPLEEVIQLSAARCIPVVVDAAAQQPPASNLWYYTGLGADMVIFSGGKTLAGPQDSGLIVGRKKWIDACRRYGFPLDGICRCLKISREAMAGLYAALKDYLSYEESAKRANMLTLCQKALDTLEQCGLTDIRIAEEGPAGQDFPRAVANVTDKEVLQQIYQEMEQKGIYIGLEEETCSLFLNPLLLSQSQFEKVLYELTETVIQVRQEQILTKKE